MGRCSRYITLNDKNMPSNMPKANIKVEETEDESYRINNDFKTLETSSNARAVLNEGDSQEPTGPTTQPLSNATIPQSRILASIASTFNEASNSGSSNRQPAMGFSAGEARNIGPFGGLPAMFGQATPFGPATVQPLPNGGSGSGSSGHAEDGRNPFAHCNSFARAESNQSITIKKEGDHARHTDMRNVESYTPQVKHEPATIEPKVEQPSPSSHSFLPNIGAPGGGQIKSARQRRRRKKAKELAEAANAAQAQNEIAGSDNSYNSDDRTTDHRERSPAWQNYRQRSPVFSRDAPSREENKEAKFRKLDRRLNRELRIFQEKQAEALAQFEEAQQVEWDSMKAVIYAQGRKARLTAGSRHEDSGARSPSRSDTNRNGSSQYQRDSRSRSASPDREGRASTKGYSKSGKEPWWKDRKQK